LGLGQTALNVVEMHGAVVRDETHSHLGFILTLVHWQMLEYVLDLRAQQVNQPRLHRVVRDVDDEDEGGNLRGSVVLWRKGIVILEIYINVYRNNAIC